MSIFLLNIEQHSNAATNSGQVVSRLIAKVPKDDKVEECKHDQVHHIHMTEPKVNRLPGEALKEIPSLQLSINVFA
jgi:hypothetical protein